MTKFLQIFGVIALLCFGAFCIYVVYSLWDWLYSDREYYRGRFLITATIEVDGGLRSASSVYEISYNARRGGNSFGASPIRGARGTMPYFDLGERGSLALSFEGGTPYFPPNWKRDGKRKCERIIPSRLPIYLIRQKFPDLKTHREALNKLIDYEGVLYSDNVFPNATRFNEKQKFPSLGRVSFCHVDTVVDSAIKPVSITIEKTELSLNKTSPQVSHLQIWRSKFGH